MSNASDHVLRNREAWDDWAAEYAEPGHRAWDADPSWGIWDVPETDVEMLPDDATGLTTIELGCGTAYVSAWLARRGAHVVGIDNSSEQLRTATRLQEEFDLAFPILQANAEHLPFADESFDLAISEYGASIWADPYLWIPEAARVLRPGGRLHFLVNGTILMLCSDEDVEVPASNSMQRDYFGIRRFEWTNETAVDFHLGYGDMIRLLRATGFDIEDFIEIRAPQGATTGATFVTAEWAHRWPSEEVWKARKRA